MVMSERRYDAWFKEAKEAKADFKAGNVLFDQKLFNLAVFHFLQASEKAMKALLYLNNTRPWGHSITTLLEEYDDLDKHVIISIKDAALDIEPHYTASRYPGDATDVAPSDIYDEILASDVKEKAQTIIDFVEQERKDWKPKP
jgi:HEPN domain-containing protein